MRLLIIFLLVAALLPATGVFGQEDPCDLNHNGYPDVADLVMYLNFVDGNMSPPYSLPLYDPELDCDWDGLHLTINDATGLAYRLIRGLGWGQGHQWWLPADSLYIPETEIYHGDFVDIPVYLRSEHPLTYVQMGLRYDPELLEIDEFIVSDSIPGEYSLRGYSVNGSMSLIVQLADYNDEIVYSGHLGNLKARALVGGPEELETAIEFFTNPRQAVYNGICSYNYVHDAPGIQLLFTHPTTVDGVVRIVGGDRLDGSAPGDSPIAFNAYPNPFNSSVEIAFQIERECNMHISVFDVLGRQVTSLADGRFSTGEHRVLWKAGNLPSGLYFCRLVDDRGQTVKRITLLR
jgi:hypothetical protein